MKKIILVFLVSLFGMNAFAKKKELSISGQTTGCAPVTIEYGINFKKYAKLKWEFPAGVLVKDIDGLDLTELENDGFISNTDTLVSLEMYGYFRRKLKVVYLHENKEETKTIKRKSNLFFTRNEMRQVDLFFQQGGVFTTNVSGKFGILGIRGSRSIQKNATINDVDLVFDPNIKLIGSIRGDTISCGDEIKLEVTAAENINYHWSIPEVSQNYISDSATFLIPSIYTVGNNNFLNVLLKRTYLCGTVDVVEKKIYIDRKLEETNALKGIELEGTTRKDTISCGDVASLYTTESKYVNYDWSITNFENDFHATTARIYIPSEYSYTESSFLVVNLKRDFLCGTDDVVTKVIQIDKFVEKPKLYANSVLVTDTTKILPDCNNEIIFELKGFNRQSANYSWQFSESWISPNNTSNGFNLYQGVGLNTIKVKNESSLPSKGNLNVSMTSKCSAGHIREINKYLTLYSKGEISNTHPNLLSESCDTVVNYITSVGLHIPYSIKWNSENNTGHFAFNNINSSGFKGFSNSFISKEFYEGKLYATIQDSLGCEYKDSIQVKILGKSENNDVSGWMSHEIKSDLDYSVLTNFTYGGDLPFVYFLDGVSNTIKYLGGFFDQNDKKIWSLHNTGVAISNKQSNLIRDNDKLFYVNEVGEICFRNIDGGRLSEEFTFANTKTSLNGKEFFVLDNYSTFISLVYLDNQKNLVLTRSAFDSFQKKFITQKDTVLIPFQQNPANGVIGGFSKHNYDFYYWKTDFKLYQRSLMDSYNFEKEVTSDPSINLSNPPKVRFDFSQTLYYTNNGKIEMIPFNSIERKTISISPLVQGDVIEINPNFNTIYYINSTEIYQVYKSQNFKNDSTFLTIKASKDKNNTIGYLSLNHYGNRNPLFKTNNNKLGELTYSYKEGICFQPRYFKTISSDFEEKRPILFPNPTSGILNINFGNELQHIKIINSIGRIVYETSSVMNTVDLSNMPSGIYLVEIRDVNQKVSVQKIEKE